MVLAQRSSVYSDSIAITTINYRTFHHSKKILCPYLNGIIYPFRILLQSSLYTLDRSPLSDMWFANSCSILLAVFSTWTLKAVGIIDAPIWDTFPTYFCSNSTNLHPDCLFFWLLLLCTHYVYLNFKCFVFSGLRIKLSFSSWYKF